MTADTLETAVRREPLKAALNSNNYADFIEWDVRNWSRALHFWGTHTSQQISKCSVLEIGSQNGGLSLWMALNGARVLSSDLGPPAKKALQLHRQYGVSHLIQYASIDCTHIPYTDHFDIVAFKSVLGAIGKEERQVQAIQEIYRALKKGGELFFAENLVGCRLHRYFRSHFVDWGNTWRYISFAEMNHFLSPFSEKQFIVTGFAGAFGRDNLQRNLLGLLDQVLLNHVVPDTSKYILIGIAKK